jgi:hypothetical protein
MELAYLAEVIGRHLLQVYRVVDFDVVMAEGDEAVDFTTDHWTIHLERGSGFLAIDHEPDEASAYAGARREVMTEAVERAIVAADKELRGVLSAALEASRDPFTLDFVQALRAG